jgi:transposase
MERLEMSQKELQRLEVLSRVKRVEISLVKASALLHLSYRQTKRLFRRFCREGDRGLVHRLRGQPSNRKVDDTKRRQVLQRYQECYADFGPTLAAEYLAKEGLPVSVETLRGWLLSAGLGEKKRKRPVHRSWRARKEHCGEMLQLDGSHHDWFEGRRDEAVLMVAIDDATNRTYARFFEGETTAAAFEIFRCYVEFHGLPMALYVDKDSIYRSNRDRTIDEELAGELAKTQFGRAMAQLGVELICAHSPQAKGRVERRNQLFQDRLVKALRLEGICDLATANDYLEKSFLPDLNERFTVAPRQRSDLHRRLPKGVDLAEVLAFEEERVVQNDWTVRWRNRWFQLTAANGRLGLVGKHVLVREQLDGRVGLVYRGQVLEYRELPDRPEPAARPGKAKEAPQAKIGTKPRRPAENHPWRRSFKRSRAAIGATP